MALLQQLPPTPITGRDKRDEELEGLAALPYHARLTQFVRGSTRHCIDNTVTVVDFRPLYAVTVHDLQRQLARKVQCIFIEDITEDKLSEIRTLLDQYTQALRNFEFIHSNRWNTSFVRDIAASRLDNGAGSKLQATLISELGLALSKPTRALYSDNDLLGSFDPLLMQHSTLPSHTRATKRQLSEETEAKLNNLRSLLRRFAFAIVGGIAIVSPVLIIVVDTVPAKPLAVVSASICLFAIGVAIFSKAEPEHLLAATAAYAAVLTVFLNGGATAGATNGPI